MVSDVEAFATTAFPGNIGITETKGFIQAVFDKIDLGAVDQWQCVRMDHDRDSLVLEYNIHLLDLVGIINDIGLAGAAGLGYSQPQADAAAALFEVGPNPICRRIR